MLKYLRTFLVAAPIALLCWVTVSPAFWHGIALALINSGIGGSVVSAPGTDGIINVKNYGAVGDGQLYNDGTMASGSSTLSTKQTISTATESGTTVTLTIPTGIPGASQYPPAAGQWTVGGQITVAGVSVSGYNGTFTITAIPGIGLGGSVTTVQYTTTSGLSSGSGGTASTNFPFKSSDAGKPICVQKVASGGAHQLCGTISTYTDSQDVVLSFSNASGSAVSPLAFVYATSDQTIIANILGTLSVLPNGGTVFFPAGIYGLTAEIDLPLSGSWIIEGSGSGGPPTTYNIGNGIGTPTTALMWLTTSGWSGTSAAFSIGKGAGQGTQNFQSQTVNVKDIGFLAGIGYGQDMGEEGIYATGTNNLRFDNVVVQGWAGDCIRVDSSWSGLTILNSVLQSCGGQGLAGAPVPQGLFFAGNLVVENGGGGISTGYDAAILGNTIQGNTGWEIYPGGSGIAAGNFFENGAVCTTTASCANFAYWTFSGNIDKNSPVYTPSYTSSTIPGATGGNATHAKTAVTDAAACTSGTTYSGGGSTPCAVQSDGTNWIETGAGAF